MADLVREEGVLTQDFATVEQEDFGLADVQFADQHFIDPRGRTVRMRSFYRLNPGDVHWRNKPRGGEGGKRLEQQDASSKFSKEAQEGRHRHFWEKILIDLELPLPDSGLDPIEPIGGYVRYHPEGAWYGPFDVYRKRVGPDDRVIVHCHLHTEGSAYTPLQTISSMKEHMAQAMQQRNDAWGPDWYIGFDGEKQWDENPAQALAWEFWQQKRIQFKEPPISDELIKLNVNAFPWYPHPIHKDVRIKPIAAFNAQGPITSLIRLEEGASLPARVLRDHRILAVLAGDVLLGEQPIRERIAVFGSPGDEVPKLTATEPSLLWLVRWLWKDNPVADFWLD
jgi:hypothetical protein